THNHLCNTDPTAMLTRPLNDALPNSAADISSSGTLTITDLDSPATFVAQSDVAGSYGHFTVGADGAWTYTADSAHDEFAAGVTDTDTASVGSADTTTTSVTITIVNTN